jgi:large subunit ribosomal protein L31
LNKEFKAEGESTMKKGIHPNYQACTVTCVSCGSTFETGSIKKEIKVDTCANCHPFYTGKRRFVQAEGRVDKFNKKWGLKSTEEK